MKIDNAPSEELAEIAIKEINIAENNVKTLNGFLQLNYCDEIINRDGELFAIFGDIAWRLEQSYSGDKFSAEYIPVIIDGKVLRMEPDEGRGGILHWMKTTRSNGKSVVNPAWYAVWTDDGWLRRNELKLTNSEIANIIGEEIDRGATHITGGRPWWD